MPTLRVYEVCLRDGLQNEASVVPTPRKLEILHQLVRAGCRDIEVTSFVQPRLLPQLADAADMIRSLPGGEVRFWSLVPNRKGFDRALDAGVTHLCTFMSASESHNLSNINRTIRESLAEQSAIIREAASEGLKVRSYLSTSFGCPYEGEIAVAKVVDLSMALLDAGCHEVALGDTTGMGDPGQVLRTLRAFEQAGVDKGQLAVHFHDTRGTALANCFAAWQAGIRTFDGSVSGVGGCPYAPGASGNLCTQDLVYMLERLGEDTGIDLDQLGYAGDLLERALGRPLPGKYHQYWQGAQPSASKVVG